MNRFKGFAVVGFILSLGVFGSGCAGMRAASARKAYLQSQSDVMVYEQPLEQVWPMARQVLFERGYTIADAPATGAPVSVTINVSKDGTAAAAPAASSYMLETQAKWESNNVATRSTRYLAQGMVAGQNKSRVLFTKHEQVTNNVGTHNTSERDYELEFELFKRLEPSKSATLEAEASQRAQAAANGT
jgi:hypothetical protein